MRIVIDQPTSVDVSCSVYPQLFDDGWMIDCPLDNPVGTVDNAMQPASRIHQLENACECCRYDDTNTFPKWILTLHRR